MRLSWALMCESSKDERMDPSGSLLPSPRPCMRASACMQVHVCVPGQGQRHL